MHFLKSLIYPIFSPDFYVESVGKGLKKAFGVFTLFTVLITLVVSVYFAVTFGYDLIKMPDSLEGFPDVTLQGGELTIDADMPMDFSSEGDFVMVDTTGDTQEIPPGYSQGVLLMKDGMIIRSEDTPEDQRISYDDFMSEMNIEGIELDAQTMTSFFQSFGVILIILSPLFIFAWYFVARLFSVVLMALLGFIILNAMGQENAFRKSMIVALYASIPVFYINLVFSLLGKLSSTVFGISLSVGSICCLLPLVISLIKWGVFWGLGAYGLKKAQDS